MVRFSVRLSDPQVDRLPVLREHRHPRRPFPRVHRICGRVRVHLDLGGQGEHVIPDAGFPGELGQAHLTAQQCDRHRVGDAQLGAEEAVHCGRVVVECADGPTPLAAFAVPDAPRALAVLGEAGVPAFRTPESAVEAITAAATRPATASIVLSAAIAHKTDAGGVVLGVTGDDQLVAAAREIAGRAGAEADRLLVTEMAPSGVDALVGYRVSAEVGPLLMVAAGGVTAELYRDSSLRLAPVDLATAHEMIREVKGLAPVVGHRGSQGDADALARAIVALSTLAESAPAVLEAEVNPLRVYGPGEGVTALDPLVCVAEND